MAWRHPRIAAAACGSLLLLVACDGGTATSTTETSAATTIGDPSTTTAPPPTIATTSPPTTTTTPTTTSTTTSPPTTPPTTSPPTTTAPPTTVPPEPETAADFEQLYRDLVAIRTEAFWAGDPELMLQAILPSMQMSGDLLDRLEADATIVADDGYSFTIDRVEFVDQPNDSMVRLLVNDTTVGTTRRIEADGREGGSFTADGEPRTLLVTMLRTDDGWRIAVNQSGTDLSARPTAAVDPIPQDDSTFEIRQWDTNDETCLEVRLIEPPNGRFVHCRLVDEILESVQSAGFPITDVTGDEPAFGPLGAMFIFGGGPGIDAVEFQYDDGSTVTLPAHFESRRPWLATMFGVIPWAPTSATILDADGNVLVELQY